MKVAELKRMVASIPEEFDDLPVVGYTGGYECEAEEFDHLEVVDDWFGTVNRDPEPDEGGVWHVRQVEEGERVLVIR
jgi:hypothetical protein